MVKRVTMVEEPMPAPEEVPAGEPAHQAPGSEPLFSDGSPPPQAPTTAKSPELPEAERPPAGEPLPPDKLTEPPAAENGITDAAAPLHLAVAPAQEAVRPTESLEVRVGRLEETVATLREDTRLIEERVVERVQARRHRPPEATAVPVSAAPPLAVPQAAPATASRQLPRHWLMVDLAAELRAMVAMFFDGNYYVTWSTRLIVFILVPLILLSYFWFPLAWIPLLGGILDKLLGLALAFFVYKALSREAHRYMETRPARRG
jgi:hypothetical protein